MHNLSSSTSIEKTQKIGTSDLNQQASDFALQAIQDNPNLKNNHSFMLRAIIANSSLISHLPPFLKNDSSFLESLCQSIPGIETTDQDITKAREKYKSICSEMEENPALRKDRQFMLDVIRSIPYFICFASPHLRKDISFFIEALELYPLLKKNHDFMLLTVKNHPFLMYSVDSDLMKNLEFLSRAIEVCPNLKNNRQFMLDAIKNVPYFIHKASFHLQNDSSFLAKAQEANPH
ncbi:MAG: DUF4116 domain-containing protein, partial [Verrucomicrobiota bacterium]